MATVAYIVVLRGANEIDGSTLGGDDLAIRERAAHVVCHSSATINSHCRGSLHALNLDVLAVHDFKSRHGFFEDAGGLAATIQDNGIDLPIDLDKRISAFVNVKRLLH